MLRFTDVSVQYGAGIRAAEHVSFAAADDTILAIIGGNGAGKTTLMRAASGTLGFHSGSVVGGSIEFHGDRIDGLRPDRIVARGLALVPEGRQVFGGLSVEENLLAGAATVTRGSLRQTRLKHAYEMFEVLGQRRDQAAGLLSGGEQQMLAIARGLMSGPRTLLLDEPSLGLAPQIVSRIARTLARINAEGTGIVLVEQNAAMALGIADHGIVLEQGRVSLAGRSAELRESDDIRELYLGGSTEDAPATSHGTRGVLERWDA